MFVIKKGWNYLQKLMDCNVRLWVGWVPCYWQTLSLKRYNREHKGILAHWIPSSGNTAQQCFCISEAHQVPSWGAKRAADSLSQKSDHNQASCLLMLQLVLPGFFLMVLLSGTLASFQFISGIQSFASFPLDLTGKLISRSLQFISLMLLWQAS